MDKRMSEFFGKAKIYDDEVYIDTRIKKGYLEVIEKLKNMIDYLSNKYNIPGNTISDTKQDIIVYILEGIPKFNPNKDMKLSTFLQMRVEQRLINRLRYNGAIHRNPTVLRTSLYSVRCECSKSFIIALGNDESIKDRICLDCDKSLAEARIFRINKGPDRINNHMHFKVSKMGKWYKSNINNITEDSPYMSFIYGIKSGIEDRVLYERSLNRALRREDPKIRELVDLMNIGYSISVAAKTIGISSAHAYKKLKSMRKNKAIKEIFGK